MKKIIAIGGRNYFIEYGIEATFYSDCSAAVMDYFLSLGSANVTGDIKKAMESICDIPRKCMHVFYAGLMQHNPSVNGLNDAKKLLVQYSEESGKTLHEIFNELLEQMGADNFLQKTGLDKFLMEVSSPDEAEENQTVIER